MSVRRVCAVSSLPYIGTRACSTATSWPPGPGPAPACSHTTTWKGKLLLGMSASGSVACSINPIQAMSMGKANLEAARECVGLAQKDVVDALYVTVDAVKKWENYSCQPIPGDVVALFAAALGELATDNCLVGLPGANAAGRTTAPSAFMESLTSTPAKSVRSWKRGRRCATLPRRTEAVHGW